MRLRIPDAWRSKRRRWFDETARLRGYDRTAADSLWRGWNAIPFWDRALAQLTYDRYLTRHIAFVRRQCLAAFVASLPVLYDAVERASLTPEYEQPQYLEITLYNGKMAHFRLPASADAWADEVHKNIARVRRDIDKALRRLRSEELYTLPVEQLERLAEMADAALRDAR